MKLLRVVHFATGAFAGAVMAFAQPAGEKAAPAAGKDSGPARGPGRGKQDAKKARPNFWDVKFNFASAFNNQGIDTYRHGTLVSKKLHFNGTPETEVGYAIYLPPDYDKSDARYPILYFMHGLGGNENTLSPVVQKAHELIKAGELPPFIIASAACGRSFYGNQFEGKCQTHDFVIEEFIPHIEKTYRVKPGRSFRHIQGFSMGGYGAFMFAFKHPEMFGGVTDIAGALVGARFNVWAEMYDSKEEHYRPFDLAVLIDEHKSRFAQLRIAQWIGSEDITRNANMQFHGTFTEKAVAHSYNDWNSRPLLNGVPHNLPRYFELYGKEILKFHTDAFGP